RETRSPAVCISSPLPAGRHPHVPAPPLAGDGPTPRIEGVSGAVPDSSVTFHHSDEPEHHHWITLFHRLEADAMILPSLNQMLTCTITVRWRCWDGSEHSQGPFFGAPAGEARARSGERAMDGVDISPIGQTTGKFRRGDIQRERPLLVDETNLR